MRVRRGPSTREDERAEGGARLGSTSTTPVSASGEAASLTLRESRAWTAWGQKARLAVAVCLFGLLLLMALRAEAQPVGSLAQLPGPSGCIAETSGGGSCVNGRVLDDPTSVAASLDGKSVYVASLQSDGVAILQRSTATGALTQEAGTQGCVTETGSTLSCIDGRAVEAPVAVAISPDNKSVYVASSAADGVAVFSRDTTNGHLTQLAGTAGCVTESGSGGICADGRAMENPVALTVSSDSKNVYVASAVEDGVAVFARNTTTGALTQLAQTAGCISDRGTGGCADGRELGDPTALAAFGGSLYVTSNSADGVAVLRRNTTTGVLSQAAGAAGCITERGSVGTCADGRTLDDPTGVAVSPNGKNVYVTSDTDDGVAVFTRATTGALSQAAGPDGCVTESGSSGVCRQGRALKDPVSVVATRDSKSVYVGSNGADGIAAFSRNLTNGSLTQLEGLSACVTDRGSEGCGDGRTLEEPTSVAVSGDSKNVYVASHTGDGVAVLARKLVLKKGEVDQLAGTAGCVSETGSSGACADGKALDSANTVAMSPDGNNAYVTSGVSDAVAIFSRNTTTGALTQLAGTAGCISETGTAGACVDGKALDGARSVTVSPDGANVYVTAELSDAIAVFSRNTTTGALTQLSGTAGCISLTSTGGACVKGRGIDTARSVAVSGDGKHAYVASFDGDSVTAFSRNTSTGQLTQLAGTAGCIRDTGTASMCVDGKALNGAISVAVSSNGSSVYVASLNSDAVAAFSRNATTGQLTQLAGTAACVSETGSAGECQDGKALDGARGVRLVGDDKHVYVASFNSNAVAAFARNSTSGALTQLAGTAGCVSETGTAGTCADGKALGNPGAVVLAGAGANAYVASEASSALSVFSRNATSGALTQLAGTSGCVSEDGTAGACTDGKGLFGARGVTASFDGKNIYVASPNGDSVAIFSRQP
jgi:6-phosphogluconolactonase (cycloisomerase 2 family)